MKTIRHGEVWFSTLDEALDDARRRSASSMREPPASAGAYADWIGLGALAVLGLAVVRELVRA